MSYERDHHTNIKIDARTAERIRNDLDPHASLESIRNRYDKDQTESWTVDFGDGVQMDIKLCCSDFYEDGTNPLWTEVVLFINGAEVAGTDPSDMFFKIWEIEHENTVYRCVVAEADSEKTKLPLVELNALIAYLDNNGANEPTLTEYITEHGDESILNPYYICPVCNGDDIGSALVPVKEGILYLPYNRIDEEFYEIFDTEKARILHKKELQDIADSWREYKDSLDSGLDAMLSMAGEVNKDQKLPVCTLEKNSHITVPRPFR